MRSSKYHDYTVLKISLFVILVILGLVIYLNFVKTPTEHVAANDAWEIVEATCTKDGYRYRVCEDCGEKFDKQIIYASHTPLAAVKENQRPHTETEGASYDIVIYCKDCNNELSREKVMVNGAHTVEIAEKTEVIVEKTCTVDGKYINVKYCKGCNYEFSKTTINLKAEGHNCNTVVVNGSCTEDAYNNHVCQNDNCDYQYVTDFVAAPGHTFEWKIVFENGEPSVSGKCLNSECDFDPELDSKCEWTIEKDESSVIPTCVKGNDTYVAVIYYNGEVVARLTEVVELDPVMNHTIMTESGEAVDFTTLAKEDSAGDTYFNISTYGIYLVYTIEEGQTKREAMNAAWDDNGFAYGVFKCTTCNEWIVVRVYNDLA